MQLFNLNILLIILSWNTYAQANEQTSHQSTTSFNYHKIAIQDDYIDYLMIPYERCKELTKENRSIAKIFCRNNSIPKGLAVSGFTILNAEAGLVRVNTYNSLEEDGKELLCYRCAFKKEKKDECGRYKTIWDNKDWAPNCPSTI